MNMSPLQGICFTAATAAAAAASAVLRGRSGTWVTWPILGSGLLPASGGTLASLCLPLLPASGGDVGVPYACHWSEVWATSIGALAGGASGGAAGFRAAVGLLPRAWVDAALTGATVSAAN